ncbi:MAG TPA: glycosyltransferase family A protein [Bryobacteraceae bacterium]|jgi:glycosyltransferase involved in cell wall biosynthesis|nr:glycosyltransferase family A protein [Bryobacteraceae bacterium]
MNANAPAISIVIPCYKVTDYIREALESVRAQTFRDFETLVVNDGCPDSKNLERILQPYRNEILYIRQENSGVAAARNTAIRIARAPLIALLDGDDSWSPDYLETQTALFRANPDADVVYPNALCFGGCEAPFEYFERFPHLDQVTFGSLVTRRAHVSAWATVKRTALIRCGLYDTAMRAGTEDLDLWLRMARRGAKFVFNSKPVYRYRSRRGSFTSDLLALLNGELQVFRKHLNDPDLTREERIALETEIRRTRARVELIAAKQALYHCRRDEALQRFSCANRVLHSGRLQIAVLLLRVCPRLLYTYIHRRYPDEYSYLH